MDPDDTMMRLDPITGIPRAKSIPNSQPKIPPATSAKATSEIPPAATTTNVASATSPNDIRKDPTSATPSDPTGEETPPDETIAYVNPNFLEAIALLNASHQSNPSDIPPAKAQPPPRFKS